MNRSTYFVYFAFLIVLVVLYWAMRHRWSLRSYYLRELSMTGSSEASASHKDGDVEFLPDGTVLFMGSYVAFDPTETINHKEEYGLWAKRRSGAVGEILYIGRPDGVVQRYRFEGLTWYQLVPRSGERETCLAACIRYFRHRGITALVTIPQDFLNTAVAVPGFLSYVAFRIILAIYVPYLVLSVIFYDENAVDYTENPVFTRQKETPEPKLLTLPDERSVECIAWTKDALVVGTDAGVDLLDVHTGALTKMVKSPDGLGPTVSAIAGNPRTGRIAAVIDGEVLLWEKARGWTSRPPPVPPKPLSGSPWATTQALDADVRKLCFSPSGQVIATLGGDGVLGTVEILDAGNLTQIATLPTKGRLVSAAFSADGKLLAVSNSKERVFLWNVAEKRLIATLDPPSGVFGWAARAGSILAFSPVKEVFVTGSGGGPIHFWDVKEGLHIKELDFMRYVLSLSYSSDGKLLLALLRDGDYGQLEIIDTSDYAVLASLTPSVASVSAMFSPVDADLVAVAGEHRIQILRVSDVLRQSKKDTPPLQTP